MNMKILAQAALVSIIEKIAVGIAAEAYVIKIIFFRPNLLAKNPEDKFEVKLIVVKMAEFMYTFPEKFAKFKSIPPSTTEEIVKIEAPEISKGMLLLTEKSSFRDKKKLFF